MKTIKKRNLLIAASNNVEKTIYYSSLLDLPNIKMIKSLKDSESIIIYNYKDEKTDKNYRFHILRYTTNLISEINKFDGLIYIYSSNDSYAFLKDFDKKFHSIYGNKNYPTVYVNCSNRANIKKHFPFIEAKKFNILKWNEIFSTLIDEMNKEKTDKYPYNLPYIKGTELQKTFRHKTLFNFLHFFMQICYIILSIIDMGYIIFLPDFLNEIMKIDEFFLGIRINLNIINLIFGILCIKTYISRTFLKIKLYMKINLFFNLIGIFIISIIRFNVRKILNKNEYYYTFPIFQIFSLLINILECLLINLILKNISNEPNENYDYKKLLDINNISSIQENKKYF